MIFFSLRSFLWLTLTGEERFSVSSDISEQKRFKLIEPRQFFFLCPVCNIRCKQQVGSQLLHFKIAELKSYGQLNYSEDPITYFIYLS